MTRSFFFLVLNADHAGNGPAVLRLVIHYLTVNEGELVALRHHVELTVVELESLIESALESTNSSGLRRAVDRRLKDRTLMNGYASRGWSAVFDSSWVEEVVAKGQSPAKEIEGLLEVCYSLSTFRRLLILQRLATMPKPDDMRTLEIPVDVPSRRVSPPTPLFSEILMF